jgi:hypothetical protein
MSEITETQAEKGFCKGCGEVIVGTNNKPDKNKLWHDACKGTFPEGIAEAIAEARASENDQSGIKSPENFLESLAGASSDEAEKNAKATEIVLENRRTLFGTPESRKLPNLPPFTGKCANCPHKTPAHCWDWATIDGKPYKYDMCRNRSPEEVKEHG